MPDAAQSIQTATPARQGLTAKVAVVIYSNVTTEAPSRAYRAMGFAAELLEAGDDVTIVFDGGGVETLAVVLNPSHDLHRSWRKVSSALLGACDYCAKAYGVHETLRLAGVPMLKQHRGHASLRDLLLEGRQIITF
jgi:hypothetical protein